MKLGLYGAGGLGSEVLEIVKAANAANPTYEDVFFVADEAASPQAHGLPLRSFADVAAAEDPSTTRFAICVGEPKARGALADKVRKAGFALATIVHPEIEVPDSATLGQGVIVYRYCNIGPNARIGENTALLLGANAPHDNNIGENCVLSTNATLSGSCTVGDNAYIAAGAVVKEGVSIGDWAIVGLGSVVFKDIEAETITIGNPAKKVGKNDAHTVFGR